MPLRSELNVQIPGPAGCENIDGRVVEVRGLRIAGLGGSLRYKAGPNQYSQGQAGRRALRLEVRIRLKRVRNGRKLDILLTHAPPYGLAEAHDSAHVGFVASLRLIQHFQPLLAVNVVPSRVLDI
jgi:Icc-related predicted phosphoesterase